MSNNVASTPEARLSKLASDLRNAFTDKGCEVIESHGEVTLVAPCDNFYEIASDLRDSAQFKFEEAIDVCGVDYSTYGESEWQTDSASSTGYGRGVERDMPVAVDAKNRFAAVYHLLSLSRNVRLRVRVPLDAELPIVKSVCDLWPSVNWFEREAFDLFGILFDGHPDLRRILTDYGFVGYPFRKDFPLEGHVEMRYDAEQQRVIYEPVKLVPRTLVPRVIRNTGSQQSAEKEENQDKADA